MRGDRPAGPGFPPERSQFTPHARGSTLESLRPYVKKYVYPACAGIDLHGIIKPSEQMSLPRMRGDRPAISSVVSEVERFTPHARGSTPSALAVKEGERVYPACAGIDLNSRGCVFHMPCLPRMRGDRPKDDVEDFFEEPFTPHARGSTVQLAETGPPVPVYPACAGIDLVPLPGIFEDPCLPRMRGDRPPYPINNRAGGEFTPHARGSTRCS